MTQSSDLLFEIGLEEMPARFMPDALGQLGSATGSILLDNRLEHGDIKVYGTPRRLAVYVKAVSDRQSDLVREARGPSAQIAFDEDGNPTKAAQGFARGQGVDTADLEVRDIDGGRYVFATVKEEGRPTLEVLAEGIPKIMESFNFPKQMRWGRGEVSFARPIRWLACLFGEQVVDFTVAGIRSDGASRSHRTLGSGRVRIGTPGQYLEALLPEGVMADPKARQRSIREGLEMAAAEVGGRARVTGEQIEFLSFLVEYPTVIRGDFDRRYLDLPVEVLTTSMWEHQKYVPVYGSDGQLLPCFLTVRNGGKEHADIVRAGNERVLKARLEDASFFYGEDKGLPLADRVEGLKEVLFHRGLGTLHQKARRLKALAGTIGTNLGLPEAKAEDASRAAWLAKADLTTLMVREFTELQGVMGRDYALASGEKDGVAAAIFEHYQPRSAGDDLPASILGQIASLADKMDTLVGYFGLDIIPSGSRDPYGLRRAAQGVVAILVKKGLDLGLKDLIKGAWQGYEEQVQEQVQGQAKEKLLERDSAGSGDKTIAIDMEQAIYSETREKLLTFFRDRTDRQFRDDGISYDTAKAVLAAGYDNLADAWSRAKTLQEATGSEAFNDVVTAFTRVANLASSEGAGETTGAQGSLASVDESLLAEPAEEALYQEFRNLRGGAEEVVGSGDYQRFFALVAAMRPAVDRFFDDVMVMVDDDRLRANRLALLQGIAALVNGVAHLAELVIED